MYAYIVPKSQAKSISEAERNWNDSVLDYSLPSSSVRGISSVKNTETIAVSSPGDLSWARTLSDCDFPILSRGSPDLGDQTWVSCTMQFFSIAGGLPSGATKEVPTKERNQTQQNIFMNSYLYVVLRQAKSISGGRV